MRSANWKMAMLYKVKCPINSLSLSVLSEAGTVTSLSLSIAVYELVCCEQWNSGAVIPLVLVHWAGRRVNGEGGRDTAPGPADRGPTLTHTLDH